jgi:acyl-CoA dehydrogenase
MQAVAEGDLARFDRAFFKHIGFASTNATRALLRALTAGRLTRTPGEGRIETYFQRLSRMSSAFAIVSDVAMATLGGRLKRREKISARLADVLAWMYLASAALKQYFDHHRPQRELPFVSWSCEHALFEIQNALLGILDNLPSRPAAWLLKVLVFPLGARRRPPSDRLGSEVARQLLEDRDARLELTKHIYQPRPHEPGLGKLEAALEKAVAAHAVETKIRDAVRSGKLDRAPGDELLEIALEARVITEQERQIVLDADEARAEVIQVDAFDAKAFLTLR